MATGGHYVDENQPSENTTPSTHCYLWAFHRQTITMHRNQLFEANFTLERQNICAKIDVMKAFGIAARGLASASNLLFQPSMST